MKLIRRILLLALLIVLGLVLFQNQQALGTSVELAFLKGRVSLVLGFWLLFAFAAGAALFALVDAWRAMFLRLEIRRKNAEILRLKQENAELAAGRPSIPGYPGGE
jgi:uncharacterized integral membrane protein